MTEMTDRILSEESVDYLEAIVEEMQTTAHDVPTVRRNFLRLIASHRLLQQQVAKLETTIGWYEEKHPND